MSLLSAYAQNIIPVRNANVKTYDYIDTITKKIISKYSYDQASPFSEGMARVNRNGLFGFINTMGDEIIPCKYIHANDFSEGVAPVSTGTQVIIFNIVEVKDERYGVIDKSGENRIPFDYNEILIFKKGMASAQDLTSKKWGWIDLNGNWKIQPQYDWTSGFDYRGISKVGISEKEGYINSNGVKLIPIIFGYLGDYNEDIIMAGDDYNHLGFIDKKGEILIPFVYDNTEKFEAGLAKVSRAGKWGYIDKSGQIKIALKYNYISNFKNGYAWLNENGFWGVANKAGQITTPVNFDFIIEGIAPNRILVAKGGLWGMSNISGKLIIPIKYELITLNDSITFKGITGDHHYFYDINGNLLSERIIRNWHNPYEKDLTDNWSDCSWKENETVIKMYQKPVAGRYFIDSVNLFYNIIRKNNNYGVEEGQKKIIVNPIYDSIKNVGPDDYNYYGENKIGLLACYHENKIDLSILKISNSRGTFESKLINTDYDVLHNLEGNDNFIRVGKKGKFGMVELVNNQIVETVPLRFDDVGFMYQDSLVFVKKFNLWGLWNIKLNKMTFAYQFDNIKHVNGYAVCKKSKLAMLNYDFKISTPFIYDNVRAFPCVGSNDGNYNYIFYNGNWGVINQQGEEIFRPILSKIKQSPNHGNGSSGIYTISRQAFGIYQGYSSGGFNNPGFFLEQ